MANFSDKVSFIWSVADLLRGPYKPNQYGRVILPLTALRRMDCVLEPTKAAVLERHNRLKGSPRNVIEPILNQAAGEQFHNTSRLDFQRLKSDPDKIAENLSPYIESFSSKAREIIEYFGFAEHIENLDKANRLYLVVSRFAEIDLHPNAVPNTHMGYIFEELIRKFSESANETAGDHFTPREVIRLMVNILFAPDGEILTREGIIKTLFDPACGTGGMLSVSEEYLKELNSAATLIPFGQDYNPESYAICGSDMLIKSQRIENIKFGDSFTNDGFPGEKFDYMLANPPFGVEWKPQQDAITREKSTLGLSGRFDAGLPRINDGSFLFLQHMISKMKPVEPSQPNGGSRIGIVFNGSPLFTGDAGSGESEIRRWIIENDWLEAIIALPDQLFYNTGIFTYIWIVTNRKAPERRGKVQLINAISFFQRMRRNLGEKRHEIIGSQIDEITRIYGECREGECCKIFDNEDFGYRKITVERPLRLKFQVTPEHVAALQESTQFQNLAKSKKKDKKTQESEEAAGRQQQESILELMRSFDSGKGWTDREAFLKDLNMAAKEREVKLSAPLLKAIVTAFGERDEQAAICRYKDSNPEPDPELRDYENVPLKEDIHEYFEREVKPHAPDAWIDESKTRVGYEIPFNRHFYKYVPPRPLEEIEADIAALEKDIVAMLREVVA